jgi:subtilisin family serine protease
MHRRILSVGAFGLAVGAALAGCGDGGGTAPPPPASLLEIISGDSQAGTVGQPLLLPLVVRASDDKAAPLAGVRVTFTASSGQGRVAPVEVVTNDQGEASAQWTLGPKLGAQTASANTPGVSPVSFSASANNPVPGSTILGTVTVTSALLGTPSARPSLGGVRRLAAAGASDEGPVRLAQGTTGAATTIPDQLIVTYRPAAVGAPARGFRALADMPTAFSLGQTLRARAAAALAPGRLTLIGVSPVLLAVRFRVTNLRAADSVATELARDPAVLSVRHARWLRPHLAAPDPGRPGTIPNDPNYANQSWHYVMLDLPKAWSITTGSASVVVAVLDVGIRFDHPAIGKAGGTYLDPGGNLLGDGYDFVSMGKVALCSPAGDSTDNAADGDGYDPDPTIPDDRDPGANGCVGAPSPIGGHGLHVAGTIGAIGNDGVGVLGVDWTVRIRPVRVLGISGGSDYDVAQGVLYAAGLPADNGQGGVVQLPVGALPTRVINMSFGGSCPAAGQPDVLHDAIVRADSVGVLLVASAGNSASTAPICPAAYPEVLSVGAVGPSGGRASYSNYGPTVAIAAPGGDLGEPGADGTYGIFSTVCDFTVSPPACPGHYARYEGTSMAAPHVSGVAALLLAQDQGLTASQLRSRLVSWATPLDPSLQLGAGIVNARNSLTQTLAPARTLYVRLFDAVRGAVFATQGAGASGQFSFTGVPAGPYLLYAGEDEAGDTLIGLPDRRWGAEGGAANPVNLTVTPALGVRADFRIGFPVEREPNGTGAQADLLTMPGSIAGSLTAGDSDLYRIPIATPGTYTFDTFGFNGAYCAFGLNVNTALILANASGAILASSDDPDTGKNDYCGRVTTTLPAGSYLLTVKVGSTPASVLPPPIGQQGRYILQARAGS